MQGFDASVGSFTTGDALFLARVAEAAYLGPGPFRTAAGAWGSVTIKRLDNGGTDTQGAAVGDDQAIVVVFRGTEIDRIADILTDGDVKLTAAFGGKVHDGFLRAWMSVRDDTFGAVRALQDEAKARALWFTGHSLGGAVATLAAAAFIAGGVRVAGLCTFGSPRVGDGKFCGVMNARLGNRAWRVVHGEDVVTRVPPRQLGYEHVGVVKMLSDAGKAVGGKSVWDDFLERVTDVVEGALPQLRMEGLADHKMAGYVASLERL